MSEEELFELPFHEYMAYRTKFAVDHARRSGVIDMDYAAIAFLQALWARSYWFNRNTNQGE